MIEAYEGGKGGWVIFLNPKQQEMSGINSYANIWYGWLGVKFNNARRAGGPSWEDIFVSAQQTEQTVLD